MQFRTLAKGRVTLFLLFTSPSEFPMSKLTKAYDGGVRSTFTYTVVENQGVFLLVTHEPKLAEHIAYCEYVNVGLAYQEKF